jgi:hypothetical protein
MDSPLGKVPTLIFRFVKGDGIQTFPDMTLVGDPGMMRKIPPLVTEAVDSAIKGSR